MSHEAEPPSAHSPDGIDGRDGRRGCLWTLALAAAGLLVLALPLAAWFYETKWPPTVEDRELRRIGLPVVAAHPAGRVYTSSGSVTCIDQCLVRARAYRVDGQFGPLGRETLAHLQGKGYSVPRPLGACVQMAWPRPPGSWRMECTLSGRRGKFTATVSLVAYGAAPWVTPTRPASGYDSVGSPPPGAPVTIISVEVGY